MWLPRVEPWDDYSQREHAKRWFSKLASMLRLRVEWADDKLAPIPYELNCQCSWDSFEDEQMHVPYCPLNGI